MRIVYVSWEYPPRFGGGIGTFVHAIARVLARRGHDVTVITYTEAPYPEREIAEGVHIIRLPLPTSHGPEPMATLRHWQARADAVAALLRKMSDAGEVDLIEFGDYRGEGITWLASTAPEERPVSIIRLHTPVVVLNRYNASRPRHQVFEAYENQGVQMADRVVSPSEALAREIRRAVPGVPEIELSPYPADPTFLDVDRSAARETGDEVLYVGRLEERKGVRTLIAAAERFLDACPDATLMMIGGDTVLSPTEPSMKAVLLRELPGRLHDRVVMPGPIPREELIERYLRARFCVFPSHFENFPNTCLEAMSLGRCVIGTTNSGMAEMIEDGASGVIVPSAEVEPLADAMIRLYQAPPEDRRAMGDAARQRMIDKYLPDAIAANIESQYERSIAGHPWQCPREVIVAGESPRVAVVIPCYNHGAYVPEAVASVQAQTYPRVEMVVVDDGSTDPETQRVLERMRADGVRVISQENQGLSAARNAGVRATDAPFYVALDADDRIEPTFVEKLLAPLLEDPTLGYCYCHARFFGAADGTWECEPYDPYRLPVENLSVATAVVRRRAFDLVGGYARDMVYGFEDWDLWLAFLAVGYHGRRVAEPLFCYRKHEGGSMLSETQAKRPEMVRQMIEHHRELFSTMLESSLVRKDAMFFDAHMRSAALAAGAQASTVDDELYQRLQAKAELDYIENSRLWRTAMRIKGMAPCRWLARLRYGKGLDDWLRDPDPLVRLRQIKSSRTYRTIQALKRSAVYRAYARRKYGEDWERQPAGGGG